MRKLPEIHSVHQRRSASISSSTGPVNLAGLTAIVGLGLTIGAALLYAMHRAYDTGYYRAYGLSHSLFDTSWHSAVYSGSLQSLSSVASCVAALFAVAVMYFVLALVLGVAGKSRVGRSAQNLYQTGMAKIRQMPVDSEMLFLAAVTFLPALFCVVCFVVYIVLLSEADKAGARQASKEIAMIRTNNAVELAAAKLSLIKIFYTEGGTSKVEEGINIDCQYNTVCAIRQADRTIVIPAKHILRMDTRSAP